MSGRPSWTEYAIGIAYAASVRSVDHYLKVGAAVLRSDRSVASLGYNGPPAGVEVDQLDRVTRRRFAVHAEINALRWTTPRDVAGGLLAVTHHPCGECVRTAAGYGIKEIVWAEPLDWSLYNRPEIEAVADACQVTLQRCVPNG